MDSQSLGDVLNKCLFKGRCCPVLPQNIPWDWRADPCTVESLCFQAENPQLFHGGSHSQCEAAASFHRCGTAPLAYPTLFPTFECIFFFFFLKTFCIFSLVAALARVVLFCHQPLELEISNPSFCHQWQVKEEPALIARLWNSNSLESCCKSTWIEFTEARSHLLLPFLCQKTLKPFFNTDFFKIKSLKLCLSSFGM